MSIPFPENVIIDIGTICGYKCIFCSASRKKPIYLPFDKINEIINTIPKIKLLNIGGSGEFFFHPDIDKILNLIFTKQIPFVISTNGEYLTKERQEILKKSSLQYINFSLNSLNPETKRLLSGDRGNFDIVMENFKNFVKLPRSYDVGISFVITNYNYKEMPDFIQFAIDHQITRVSLTQLSTAVSYTEDIPIPNDNRELSYYIKAKELADKNKIIISGMNRTKENKQIKRPIKECPLPWTHTGIMPDGRVVPCCYLPFIAGDLNKNNFTEIWNNQQMEDLRNAIHMGSNKFCMKCPLFE